MKLFYVISCFFIIQETNALYLQNNNPTRTEPVGLICPTIVGATVAENCSIEQCIITLKTRTGIYQFTDGNRNERMSSKTFSYVKDNLSYDPLNINNAHSQLTIVKAREYAKGNFMRIYGSSPAENRKMLLDDKFKDTMEIPRAAEIFQHKPTNEVATHEDHIIGVFDYKIIDIKKQKVSNFDGSGMFDLLEAVQNETKSLANFTIDYLPYEHSREGGATNINKFRFSAVTVTRGPKPESVYAWFFDEAGRIHRHERKPGSRPSDTIIAEKRTDEFENITSWILGDLPILDYGESGLETFPLGNDLGALMTAEIGAEGLKSMKEQFNLAHIESITLFKEALCFSRGLAVYGQPSVRCMNDGKFSSIRLPEVFKRRLDNPSKDLEFTAAFAMEIVELSDSINYHLVFNDCKKGGCVNARGTYWFCRIKNTELRDTVDACDIAQVQRTPIDIVNVNTSSCHYLATFYPFMYQINRADQGIHEQGTAVFAPWMTFDANAIMAQRNKLYFFLSGNVLLTYDFNPLKCDSIEIFESSAKYFLASELLRMFGKTYIIDKGFKPGKHFANHTFKESSAYYTGFTQRLAGKWSPSLRDSINVIDADTQLSISRLVGKDGSSIVTIVILILIILVLLVGTTYCLCFSRSDQEDEMIVLKNRTNSKQRGAATEAVAKSRPRSPLSGGVSSKQGSKFRSSSGQKSTIGKSPRSRKSLSPGARKSSPRTSSNKLSPKRSSSMRAQSARSKRS